MAYNSLLLLIIVACSTLRLQRSVTTVQYKLVKIM